MTTTHLVKLYGERNSGTRYLSKLIELNLDATLVPGVVAKHVGRLQRALPGREWLRDAYFASTYRSNLGWKHAAVDAAAARKLQARRAAAGSKLILLTLTKNPYAWLLSLYDRPYHSGQRDELDFESFLHTPWRSVGRDNLKRAVLPTPIELWNVKNRSYLKLTRSNPSACGLTYERILTDPRQVIERLAANFNIIKSTRYFENVRISTKGRSRNFAEYRDYYLNERWQSRLSTTAVATINRLIDKYLMDQFGYTVLSDR